VNTASARRYRPSRYRPSRYRLPGSLLAAACALIALAACGTQHAGTTGQPTGAARTARPAAAATAAASPRQRAEADAAHLMASFPRPPGAVRTGLIASLVAPGEGAINPDLVTVTRWWRAPGRPQAVLAWIRAHMPRELVLQGRSDGGTYNPRPSVDLPESWIYQFGLPPVPNVLIQRWLVVLLVPDGSDQTAIRVDAQVTWLPAKPAAERLPVGARAVTVTPVFGLQPDVRRERLDPAFTVTDRARVARIAALIDALPLFPPGEYSCPLETGAQMRLTFKTAPHGRVVARVIAPYGGCGIVTLTVGDRSMPALTDETSTGQQLQQQVLAIAGVRWPYRPGSLPS
jgi:hypothetical protein